MNQFNYQLHYEIWHSEETREKDIKQLSDYLISHDFMPEPTDKVLDIGCGTGNLLSALKKNGVENLEGVEIDEAQVFTCRNHGLTVHSVDVIDFLTQSSYRYDYIFLCDVLEHFPKERHIPLLTAIFNSLSENGKLFLSVPNAMAPLSHYFENIDWTHYCSFSDHSLNFTLKNAGFTNSQFRPSHRESYDVYKLKKNWKRLLEAEFGYKNPIMTPSIVSVSFKNPEDLEVYKNKNNEIFKPLKKSIFSKFISILKAILK